MAVVLAAGVGSRVGHDLPKQFLDLNGIPVLARTVGNLSWCSQVVVVAAGGSTKYSWLSI